MQRNEWNAARKLSYNYGARIIMIVSYYPTVLLHFEKLKITTQYFGGKCSEKI